MLALDVTTEDWRLKEPFRISGYTFTQAQVVVVALAQGKVVGCGEAAGVYYRNETPQTMTAQIEAVRADMEQGITRAALRELLPPGGARNAIDCALWDLEAKMSGRSAWAAAGLARPRRIATTYTIGADTAERMAETARRYAPAPRLKVKLTGRDDAHCLRAIRRARPDAWIAVDANQAFTRASLEALMPVCMEVDVRLIEQPVAVGQETELDGFRSPIALAADESVQGLGDLATAEGRFDIVNIKLDKCGGLTEALMMARAIRAADMRPMIGCMTGTSLAMLPGCVAGQLCEIVDMDAAMFLANDRTPPVAYCDGEIEYPMNGWGMPLEERSVRTAS